MMKAIVSLLLVQYAIAATYTVNPSDSDWTNKLLSLQAGDTMTFNAGEYSYSRRIGPNWQGTASSPIIIQAASGASVTLTQNDGNNNVADIQGSYFSIINIGWIGVAADGIRGLTFVGNSDHVTLDGVKIKTTANAVSCNLPGITCSDMHFKNMEIHDCSGTGEGYYLGSVPGSNQAVFKNGIIENNYIHDMSNPDGGSGAAVQIKPGSYNNIIRNNIVRQVTGPCYLTYDDYDQGVNYIYNNLCMDSGDNGIQVTAGAVVYNNIVTGSSYGIVVSNNGVQSGKYARNVKIYHNTVSSNSGSPAIYIQGGVFGSDASSFAIVNNYAENYAGEAYKLNNAENSGATVSNNAYRTGQDVGSLDKGVTAVDPKFQSTDNFYPGSGSGLIGAGTGSINSAVSTDYNCNSRSSSNPTIGAYEGGAGSNPSSVPSGNGGNPCGGGAPTPTNPTTPPTTPPTPTTPTTPAPDNTQIIEFYWTSRGAKKGSCVQITEPEDPDSWTDNYLCALNEDISSWVWANNGTEDVEDTDNYVWIQWTEPNDPHSWDNNALGIPNSDTRKYAFSASGRIPSMTCTRTREPLSKGWNNNYFCTAANGNGVVNVGSNGVYNGAATESEDQVISSSASVMSFGIIAAIAALLF